MARSMKLHLGCGSRHIDKPGWVHVDAQPYPHVDYVGDVASLPFDDETADLVYACTVLEHFSKLQTPRVLLEWKRVLKPGGVLRLSVPDFMVLAQLYIFGKRPRCPAVRDWDVHPCDLDTIQGMIIGGQRDEYDFHKNVFDVKRLKRYLREAGFVDPCYWDWRKTEHADVDDYSRAYLPHMDFETGVNTSLNIEATKP